MRLFGVNVESGFIRRARPEPPVVESLQPDPEGPATRWLGALLNAFVLMVAATGVAITVYAIAVSPGSADWSLLAVLAVLVIVAERTDMSMYGASRVSLAFVPIFAAIASSGLTGVAIVVPLAVLASAWGRPLHKTLFNFGALAVAGAATHVVLSSFGTMDYSHDWPEALVPATVGGAANFAVNSALVATAISISSRANIRAVWRENFMWLWPHYVILALIAMAIIAAHGALGLWGVAVFVAPPLMMRLSIKQYLEKTTDSVLQLRKAHVQLQQAHDQLTAAMTSLGGAYDGTLRSLVAALDARDSETAGHSERVADLTMAIAAEVGIQPDSDEWRYISWGALLHDVGKIAIPDGILRKPGSLTEEEWTFMRTHAAAGYEILQPVDFLQPAGEIVLAHHERYDGGGYPRGLVGEEIPFGARIFAIADSFDAMTSDRSYRRAMPAEEALAEILRHSGTQFDPVAVRAFLSVYQKRFVGTVHHKHFSRTTHGSSTKTELSESLKKAIAEAAGLENID